MKRKSLLFVFAFALILPCMFLLSACGKPGADKSTYWFSSYEKTFVPYDDEANNGLGNIQEAGTYWTMTIKEDCVITISICNSSSLNTDTFTHFYVDDVRVQEKSSKGYDYVYTDVYLDKGDQIKFHSFWRNSLMANSTGFTMTKFVISDDTGSYTIKDIN